MIEITGVATASADGVLALAIDGPRAGDRPDGDGFEVDGWLIGRERPVAAVEVVVVADGEVRSRVVVERPRPDVGGAYPAVPWAPVAGFRAWVPTACLPSPFVLDVRAIVAGTAVTIATIRGRRTRDPESAADDAAGWPGPDFLVIGAQRSGTTSLFRYLSQHPQVVPARIKEVKYFSLYADRPWGWYRDQFPATLPADGCLGEATPYYLFHPAVPARVDRRLPAVRAIAILRNPIDRAYSHYFHERRRGVETLPFEEAIEREEERLAGEANRLLAGSATVSLAHQHFSYIARGRYAEQLERWYERIPRERLLVLRSEDLYADPASVVGEACDFLELPRIVLTDSSVHNEAAYPPMAAATRERLATMFRPANAALARLTGRDFGWDDPS